MCGIAGGIGCNYDWNKIKESLYHRGPDQNSITTYDKLTFVHTRLAIQDIQNGRQPIEVGDYSIIFNGEIYNHKELRKAHLSNISFKTHSDTETLLYLFIKYKFKMFELIDGMFAFAILNRKTNQLFLARDRAGEKPLYYYLNKEKKEFFFASELNSFDFKKELNNDAIAAFLKTGFFVLNSTPFENIYNFEAATYAVIDLNNFEIIEKKKYFKIEDYYQKKSTYLFNESVNILEEKLIKSVENRVLSSDLEVGAFLSGGIDSSLIVAMASKYSKKLNTFTISFDGSYDESHLAKLTAEKYNTKHHEIRISMNLKDDIEKILCNYGMPFFDSSAIPSYYVSQEAKKYLTVVLNGDGADELFAGYRRYVPLANNSLNIFKKISFMSNLLSKSGQKQSLYNYIYRLLRMSEKDNADFYLSGTNDIFEDTYAIHSNLYDKFNEQIKEIFINKVSNLSKFLIADFDVILFEDLLVKMDIATMSNSIEGRSPFLSKDLLEFVPSLYDNSKIRGTTTKYLLRQLAKKYLSKELIHQPKRGFEVPLQNWVDNELKEIIYDSLLSNTLVNNFIDKVFIKDLLDYKVDVSLEKRAKMLWSMFTLNVWHKNLVK